MLRSHVVTALALLTLTGHFSGGDAARAQSLFDEEPGVTDLVRATDLIAATPVDAATEGKSSGLDMTASSGRHLQEAACPALVVFYDSGCGHCRAMAPKIIEFTRRTFQRLRDTVNDGAHDNNVTMFATLRIGAVNCAVFGDDCRRHRVSGVPSIWFVSPPSSVATAKAGSKSHWVQMDGLTSADIMYARTQEKLSPVFATMTPNQREVCALTKKFFFKRKRKMMTAYEVASKASGGAEGGVVAAHDDGQAAAKTFVEERSPHTQDVVASLFQAMFHEVPLVTLAPPAQTTLLRFLQLVEEFLPGITVGPMLAILRRGDGVIAPSEWHAAVIAARLPVAGLAPWYATLPSLQQPAQTRTLSVVAKTVLGDLEDPPVDTDNAWHMCRGSSWKFRGYTCGLWLMYHTIVTTASSRAAAGAASTTSYEALTAIRAYVITFFACDECRQHFSKFVWLAPTDHPLGWDAEVQLWAAHNQVNRRLGRATEGQDPLVPKRQFPDDALCSDCVLPGKATSTLLSTSNDDEQAAFAQALASTYDVPTVKKFLHRWFRWNASADAQKGGAVVQGRRSAVVPPTTEDDCGGDTCPMEPPVTKAASGGGGVWFARTRHPSFIIRHDHVVLHGIKTIGALTIVFGLGYALARSALRRSSGAQHHAPPAHHHPLSGAKLPTSHASSSGSGLQWFRDAVGDQRLVARRGNTSVI